MSTIFRDILFLRAFYLNSTCLALAGNVSYVFRAPKKIFLRYIGIDSLFPRAINSILLSQDHPTDEAKILTDIFFYVTDIPNSTCTISEYNLIKQCWWQHLLEGILKGFRVWAAGLKLFTVFTDDLLCRWCIGRSLWLQYKWAKLALITDIFVLTYSFWLVPTNHISCPPPNRRFPISTRQAEIDPQVNITRHSCRSLPALAT